MTELGLDEQTFFYGVSGTGMRLPPHEAKSELGRVGTRSQNTIQVFYSAILIFTRVFGHATTLTRSGRTPYAATRLFYSGYLTATGPRRETRDTDWLLRKPSFPLRHHRSHVSDVTRPT